ncbi:N-acetylmuramoyl-L-alanine amidase [Mesorhizobium sp. M0016]|uniref:peptidoglycan recognition protein family protein n=1 Tax=Mesorhizobium sp. M0016 TaxID=2956843 RepID=UPI00333DD04E
MRIVVRRRKCCCGESAGADQPAQVGAAVLFDRGAPHECAYRSRRAHPGLAVPQGVCPRLVQDEHTPQSNRQDRFARRRPGMKAGGTDQMARCPFAVWKPISGSSGTNLGGPFKIVHHTTEGSSAQGAFDAFQAHHSDPHFTVDATKIYQHIDTGEAARALKNLTGGVQTNRDSAVQIEVVGFAHRPKTRATLENVRKLCRWIESTHGVPKVWPNGPPKPAVDGHDPGGHNRNAANWDTKGGHYGHSNVPENTHWDPGYTKTEVDFLMLDNTEGLESPEFSTIILEDPGMKNDHSRMPDHADPEGVSMEMPGKTKPAAKRKSAPRKKAAGSDRKTAAATTEKVAVSKKKPPRKAVQKSPKKT